MLGSRPRLLPSLPPRLSLDETLKLGERNEHEIGSFREQ